MDNETPTSQIAESPPVQEHKPKFSRKTLITIIALLLIIIGLAVLAYVYKGALIAVTVDGKPITRLKVIRELEKQSGNEVLEALVNEQLLVNAAEAQNLQISSEEFDKRVKEIEKQFETQGTTLAQALETQHISRSEFNRQIMLQVKAEKILGDKLNVPDEEINAYITDNRLTLEAGKEAEQKTQISEQIKQQKFGQEIALWLKAAREKAKINHFVNY